MFVLLLLLIIKDFGFASGRNREGPCVPQHVISQAIKLSHQFIN